MVWAMNAKQRRAQKLRREYEAARKDKREAEFYEDVAEAFGEDSHRGSQHSIRAIFEQFVEDGHEIAQSWSRSNMGEGGVMLHESAVDTTAFSRISNQLVASEVLAAFEDPQYLANELCPSEDTPFDGEIVPGLTRTGDVSEVVGESEPYPYAGFGEEFIRYQPNKKRGHIVALTKEAVFFDRTGMLLENAREVSTWLAVNKEKRCLDTALGITDHYNRNDAGVIATYADNSGNHDWDNLQASNALQDWTDIEAALLLFDAITDPTTGEPVNVLGNLQIVVPSALVMTAMQILNATEVRDVTNTSRTTIGGNPLQGQFNGRRIAFTVHSSPYVKSRTSSATTWFIGDFKAAFVYKQNWPITTVTAPTNSEDEFKRDIIQQFKVSERGQSGVRQPRKVVKCTA